MSECKIHFLNVLNGDCTIIEHETGRISVIDICNGNAPSISQGLEADFSRQNNPTNPIDYLYNIFKDKKYNNNINKRKSIFRFILSHPDMDHMNGIENIFNKFLPTNFWDTSHEKDLSNSKDFGNYKKEDWEFYQNVRKSENNPRVCHFYRYEQYEYYTEDGFEIILPDRDLINNLKELKKSDWNEISYVILHNVYNRKILYCGDSGNKAWENIMEDENLLNKIRDIDILLAPHHGRKTGGDDLNQYLNKLNPKLAILGNTEDSKHKKYSAFYNRGIPILTNNEAGDIIATIKYNGNIYIEMTQNDWDTLLQTKNENWENSLNENKIYLNE